MKIYEAEMRHEDALESMTASQEELQRLQDQAAGINSVLHGPDATLPAGGHAAVLEAASRRLKKSAALVQRLRREKALPLLCNGAAPGSYCD